MDFSQILVPLLLRVPLLVLWLIGIMLAIRRRKEHPCFSLLAIVGFVILMMSTFFATTTPALIPQLMWGYFENRIIIESVFLLQRVFPLIDLVGWIFVLAALFGRRKSIITA